MKLHESPAHINYTNCSPAVLLSAAPPTPQSLFLSLGGWVGVWAAGGLCGQWLGVTGFMGPMGLVWLEELAFNWSGKSACPG